MLPADIRHAFEFRHESWLNDEVYSALEKHGAALCLAESEKLVVPQVITAPFVYARLRKPDYSEEDRLDIARRAAEILEWRSRLVRVLQTRRIAAGSYLRRRTAVAKTQRRRLNDG